jgi:dTDP-glucose 4,6-dehydratase
MNLLVTGGAGFIGANLVQQLLGDGGPLGALLTSVVTLDKLTYAGNLANLAPVATDPRHSLVPGDICNTPLVSELLAAHDVDAVLHLAAGGTGLFLQVSTDEVFGSLAPDAAPFSEASNYSPNSPYSASKAGADHLARAYFHTYGLPVVTTNCSNNYGPYQFPEKLLPLMIRKALRGEPLPVYGDGGNVRDWLYVGDHTRALELAAWAGRPGETYLLGGRCELTNLEVVRALLETVADLAPERLAGPPEELITFVSDRPGHDRRYAINPAKAEAHLGWVPHEDFRSGLRKTVAWYLEHEFWANRIEGARYRGERLGAMA